MRVKLVVVALVVVSSACSKPAPPPAPAVPTTGAATAPAAPAAPAPAAAPAAPAVPINPTPAANAGAAPKKVIKPPAGSALSEAAKNARRERLLRVKDLGRQGDAASVSELMAIAQGDKADITVRAAAMRSLRNSKSKSLVKDLKGLLKSDVKALQIEAAVLLYQWGEHKTALPVLEELAAQGVAIRRAFVTGRQKGKNVYDDNAKEFLEPGLDAKVINTRLDSALGLYEISKSKAALKVFEEAVTDEKRSHIRLAALNHMRHLSNDAKVAKIIKKALKDEDERVRERAAKILGTNK